MNYKLLRHENSSNLWSCSFLTSTSNAWKSMERRPTIELTSSTPDNILNTILLDMVHWWDWSRGLSRLILVKHGIIGRISSSLHSRRFSIFIFCKAWNTRGETWRILEFSMTASTVSYTDLDRWTPSTPSGHYNNVVVMTTCILNNFPRKPIYIFYSGKVVDEIYEIIQNLINKIILIILIIVIQLKIWLNNFDKLQIERCQIV